MTTPTTAAGRAARDWFLVRARFVRGGLPDAEMIEHILAIEAEARAAALDMEGLARADADVSLIHDFLYGRRGTMDEAHAACWRIHEVLRPMIAHLEAEQ